MKKESPEPEYFIDYFEKKSYSISLSNSVDGSNLNLSGLVVSNYRSCSESIDTTEEKLSIFFFPFHVKTLFSESPGQKKKNRLEYLPLIRQNWAGVCFFLLPKYKDIVSIIVKYGDDLRQEQLAMQLITQFQKIFQQEGLYSIFLKPYMVLATHNYGGLVETITNSKSLDGLKKLLSFGKIKEYYNYVLKLIDCSL